MAFLTPDDQALADYQRSQVLKNQQQRLQEQSAVADQLRTQANHGYEHTSALGGILGALASGVNAVGAGQGMKRIQAQQAADAAESAGITGRSLASAQNMLGSQDYSSLFGGGPTTADKAKAMADMLRKQQSASLYAGAMGQPDIAKALGTDAENKQRLLAEAPERDALAQLHQQQAAKGESELTEENRRLAAMADASSPESQAQEAVRQSLGLNLPPGTPGNVVSEKTLGLLEKAKQAQLQREFMSGKTGINPVNGLPYQVFKRSGGGGGGGAPTGDGSPSPQPQPVAGSRADKDINAQLKALGDDISTTKGRGNLNTDLQKRLNASERIKAIAMNEDGSIRNIPPELMTELAGASASLITNGSPAEHTIESLTPNTAKGNWAKKWEWFSGEPHGANQQEFIKLFLGQADREEKLIKGQMLKSQLKAVSKHPGIFKTAPEQAWNLLKGEGITPDMLDPKTLTPIQPQANGAESNHPDVTQNGHVYKWDTATGKYK